MSRKPLAPRAIVLTLLALGFAAPALGQSPPAPASSDGWHVSITPYFWAPGITGTLEDEGVTTEFDIDFSEIWDALDFGALVAADIRYDKVSLVTNLIYMDLSPEGGHPTGDLPNLLAGSLTAGADVQQFLLELLGGYQVAEIASKSSARRVAFDVGGGIRYTWMQSDVHVKLKPGVPLGPFSLNTHSKDAWVDPLIGGRVRAALTERIGLELMGSVGGFGVADAAHLTWSVSGALGYRFGEHWRALVGWRTIDTDRDSSDIRLSGPLFGASYVF